MGRLLLKGVAWTWIGLVCIALIPFAILAFVLAVMFIITCWAIGIVDESKQLEIFKPIPPPSEGVVAKIGGGPKRPSPLRERAVAELPG